MYGEMIREGGEGRGDGVWRDEWGDGRKGEVFARGSEAGKFEKRFETCAVREGLKGVSVWLVGWGQGGGWKVGSGGCGMAKGSIGLEEAV